MKNLMELNGGMHRHFLSGDEEVTAFKNNEFIRMHNSTLAKIGFFFKVLRLLSSGKLKTASRGWGIAIDKLFESRFAKTVGLFGTAVTIGVGLWQTLLWLGYLQ